MEPKNLAIIFGPSVVRTSNETLETVVKDMKHQCRIVEALVSHVSIYRNSIIVKVNQLHSFAFFLQYDFFFENGPTPLLPEAPEYASVSPPELQTNMLLDNVSKIESKFREFRVCGVCGLNDLFFFFAIVALKDRDSARFVTKFVQAATNRKARKPLHRKYTLSTPDTLSLDSSTVCNPNPFLLFQKIL